MCPRPYHHVRDAWEPHFTLEKLKKCEESAENAAEHVRRIRVCPKRGALSAGVLATSTSRKTISSLGVTSFPAE